MMMGVPVASSSRPPSIKGLVVREFLRWYTETRGEEATMRAYRSLPDELRAHLDPDRELFGLLAGSWYPADIAAGLLEAITEGLTRDERSALLRGGVHHTLRSALTGVYRVIFDTLVTPERHAKYAQKIWSHFYDTGKVVGTILGPNEADQVVTEWTGHHAILCELSIWSLTEFHEFMGCRNVKVTRTACFLDRRRPPPSAAASSSALGAAPITAPPPSRPRTSSSQIPSVRAPFSRAPVTGECRFTIAWE